MAKEKWYISESELDDYQVNIVRRKLESSFIVKGCAGSGKTVLALWRAKELAEKGIDNYLVIVFTKALKQFIRDGIHEIGVDESKVMYHWEWENRNGKPSADYIIIDEVQDFDSDELTELQSHANKELILFGDSAQQIYKGLPNKGRLLSMEEIQIQTKIPMENLVINHRLPKKIARVAEEISLSGDPLEGRCNKEGVNMPRLVECSSFNDQLDYIKEVCEAQNYTDVGILFSSNEDVRDAANYYAKKEWFVEKKFSLRAGNSMNLDFTSQNPKLMTYHSAKGLQFEAVFIPGCNVDRASDRNPLYVALTRSYRDLFVLYSNKLSPYIEDMDKGLFEFHEETKVIQEDDDLPF